MHLRRLQRDRCGLRLKPFLLSLIFNLTFYETMKKKRSLLAISLVSTALTDTTLYFQSLVFTVVVTGIVYFFVGFLFYDRIKEDTIKNTFLIFLFLIALITFAFIVNPAAYDIWLSISLTSILSYIVGANFGRRKISN